LSNKNVKTEKFSELNKEGEAVGMPFGKVSEVDASCSVAVVGQ
jgi:hypothetical protein